MNYTGVYPLVVCAFKGLGASFYSRLFEVVVLTSCQLAHFPSLDVFGVQLIPQITQSDRCDREMASNVVYPLKLFNSMFSNKDVLLWLCFVVCRLI